MNSANTRDISQEASSEVACKDLRDLDKLYTSIIEQGTGLSGRGKEHFSVAIDSCSLKLNWVCLYLEEYSVHILLWCNSVYSCLRKNVLRGQMLYFLLGIYKQARTLVRGRVYIFVTQMMKCQIQTRIQMLIWIYSCICPYL